MKGNKDFCFTSLSHSSTSVSSGMNASYKEVSPEDDTVASKTARFRKYNVIERKNSGDSNADGFTLVELLVSIGIIAVLSTFLYAGFSDAREQARDDLRMTQLREVQLALEQYKNQNGKYPEPCPSGKGWSGERASGEFACNDGTGEYIRDLAPDFISKLPTDIKADPTTNNGFIYRTNSSRTAYKVMANYTVEAKLVESYDNEFARCPYDMSTGWCGATPVKFTYAVYSLGAESW